MWFKTLILNRLKPQEWLILGVVVIGIGLIFYYRHQADDAEKAQRIADDARRSAEAIQAHTEAANAIDRSVIEDWLTARDQYKAKQAGIIESTFRAYQDLPTPSQDTEHDVSPEEPPAGTPGLTDDQLDVLTRGMHDTYCRARTDAAGCPDTD